MKKMLQYYGRYKERDYFAIITNDESGLNLAGVDVRWHHFTYDIENATLRQSNYMSVSPLHTTRGGLNGEIEQSIAEKATDDQARELYQTLTQAFSPLFNDIPIDSVVGYRKQAELFAQPNIQ